MEWKWRQKQSVVNISMETVWTINVATLISCLHKHWWGCICMRQPRCPNFMQVAMWGTSHSKLTSWSNGIDKEVQYFCSTLMWQSLCFLANLFHSCTTENLYIFIYFIKTLCNKPVLVVASVILLAKINDLKAWRGNLSHEAAALIKSHLLISLTALIAVSLHFYVTFEEAHTVQAACSHLSMDSDSNGA